MLETIAYYVALLDVILVLPAILFWFLIHPFARFWRRLGAPVTYTIAAILFMLAVGSLFFIREPILRIRFGVRIPLAIASIAPFALSIWMGVLRSRVFRSSTLVGLPEVSKTSGPGELITTGIYGRIRHPRYAEGFLRLGAMALFCNYLALYILLATYVPLIFIIVIMEERELTERFGTAYTEYCAQVPRFVPRLPGR